MTIRWGSAVRGDRALGPRSRPGARLRRRPARRRRPPPRVTDAPRRRAVPATVGHAGSADPPVASIGVEGGDPVVGQLGTYAWAGGGSSSPWLPGAPIAVGVAGDR